MSAAFDDETLTAYADGELPPDQAALIEAAAAGDGMLAARIARLRAQRGLLAAAYPEIEAPLPSALQSLLGDAPPAQTATVLAFRPKPKAEAAAKPQRAAMQWGGWALAAALLLAVVLTPMLFPERDGYRQATGTAPQPAAAAEDAAVAGALVNAMVGGDAQTLPDGRVLALGAAIPVNGHECRGFTLTGSGGGIACPDGESLQFLVLAP